MCAICLIQIGAYSEDHVTHIQSAFSFKMYVTHICKYSLRINSGFLYTENRKELHMNTYSCFWKFNYIYPARKWGSWIVLSLVLYPKCFLCFSIAPEFHWIKANKLRLIFSSSVLHLPLFVSQVKKIGSETLVSESSCIQSLRFPTFRGCLKSGHFLVSLLCLTFLFFHSLCIQCLCSTGSFAIFLLCLKFNILFFFIPFTYPQVTS